MKPRLVLLEFNELCPPLLDRWMRDGLLPNFKRFHDDSAVFTTVADNADQPYLNPWVQWYSLHTGLDSGVHKVLQLTEGPQAGFDDLWQVLLRQGRRVASFGSMNVPGFETDGSFYLPDPWCTSQPASPPPLRALQRFVTHNVQEHTNRQARGGGTASFLGFAATHGLRARTVATLASHLARERLSRHDVRWRRASMLDLLQQDVFMHYYRRHQPDFATFFSNSTAHYQHCYWRQMDPGSFKIKPTSEELAAYGGAILYGYQAMDRLLARFFELEREGVTLALATAHSQQPYLQAEDRGGQHYYRPRDIAKLLSTLGIAPVRFEPVMAHQYLLTFASEAEVEGAIDALRRFTVGNRTAFQADRERGNTVMFSCWLHDDLPSDTVLTSGEVALPFFRFFYRLDEIKSGCHHPDGVFWVKSGRHRVHPDKISILDVFPTILDLLGAKAGDLRPSRPGRSLCSMILDPAAPGPGRVGQPVAA